MIFIHNILTKRKNTLDRIRYFSWHWNGHLQDIELKQGLCRPTVESIYHDLTRYVGDVFMGVISLTRLYSVIEYLPIIYLKTSCCLLKNVVFGYRQC